MHATLPAWPNPAGCRDDPPLLHPGWLPHPRCCASRPWTARCQRGTPTARPAGCARGAALRWWAWEGAALPCLLHKSTAARLQRAAWRINGAAVLVLRGLCMGTTNCSARCGAPSASPPLVCGAVPPCRYPWSSAPSHPATATPRCPQACSTTPCRHSSPVGCPAHPRAGGVTGFHALCLPTWCSCSLSQCGPCAHSSGSTC